MAFDPTVELESWCAKFYEQQQPDGMSMKEWQSKAKELGWTQGMLNAFFDAMEDQDRIVVSHRTKIARDKRRMKTPVYRIVPAKKKK